MTNLDPTALIERHLTEHERLTPATAERIRIYLEKEKCSCDHEVGAYCERCILGTSLIGHREIITRLCALLTKQQAEIERLTPAWIATSERLPSVSDTDHIGYVLVWNFEQAIEVRVHITEVLWPGTEWTHWQPIRRPEPPAGEVR